MNLVTPPYLKLGDTIGIVSTARKIEKKELQPFVDLLLSWGLKVVFGDSIGASHHQFAGSDAVRLADFQTMLDQPNIKAIWCARGGYGSVRIIDQLDFTEFKRTPKWIIGYSDVTVLHNHIHNLGIETIHGQMGLEIDLKTEETRTSLQKVLFGQGYSVSYISEDNKYCNLGEAKGPLVGGNLSILYSLLGSPSEINTDGKILFIEDLDEMLYHVDRMMQNLKRNGLLDNLAGLLVGGMSDMKDNTIPYGKSAKEIVWEYVKDQSYPVCFNFPAGHVSDNRALILGREAELKVEQKQVILKF